MEALVFFDTPGQEAHFEPGHPERPERVAALRSALQAAGWWQAYPHLEPLPIRPEVLLGVHTPEYIRSLEAACKVGAHLDGDTYTTPASWGITYRASGGAAAVAEAVWQGRARRGFALTRPPGHHAMAGRGMGFCLLNNVALAAEYLLQQMNAQRLAIIDLDLHHGNGTQDIFWYRPEVFYLSVHQSPLYPGTGRVTEIGAGPGEGTTANIPLPPGSGDQAFREVMELLILPLLQKNAPQMVLVSFGFDPHWLDPLGHLRLSAQGYGGLIGELAGWADQNCEGRLALFLEGGYDLEAGAACSQAAVAALLGQPWEDPLGPPPGGEGKSWAGAVRQARDVWGL